MTDKYEKDKLADAITAIFEKKEVIEMIVSRANQDKEKMKSLGKYISRVMYYIVTTRNTNLPKHTLKRILQPEEKLFGSKFPAGEVIVHDIATKLIQQNQIPTAEKVLRIAKENYIDKGFYMHATHFSNLEGIKKMGFDSSFDRANEAKEFLTSLIDYQFNYKSNKLHVTSFYSVLFTYGIYSPEWLYCIVNDKEAVKNRDAQRAYEKILENASATKLPESRLEVLHKHAKEIVNQYFIGEHKYAVVIFDRYAKNEDGKRIFNHYEEEEDSFSEQAFEYQILKERFNAQIDDKKSVLTDKNNLMFAKQAVEDIIERASIYELKTLDKIKPDTFSVAVMPSYKEYENTLQNLTSKTM